MSGLEVSPPTTARSDASHRLTSFIRSHREEILDAWEAEVRELPIAHDLDRLALREDIPDLLDRIAEIADALHDGDLHEHELPAQDAEHHAISRLEEGFDLNQVVTEFSVLRDCITRMWSEGDPDHHPLLQIRVLNQAIDKAVTASVERYTSARDRTLKALDLVAIAALESATLDDLLQRFLDVLVETTAAVDTATILLRDGDQLRVRAAVGIDDPHGYAMEIGEGFAGLIAAEAGPSALQSAASDPLVIRSALRASGVHALYGIPLVEAGSVVGVAHMGSRTAQEFSAQDKRLFAAMANRATSAIVQFMLREARERAMAELRQRELEIRTLADNIPQLAWMADKSGAADWYNQRWLDYAGGTLEDWRGWSWHRIVHPDHRERVIEKHRVAFEYGHVWEDVFPLRGKDGQYRWFLSRAVPIRDSSGELVRWFGTKTDITEQRFLSDATTVLASSLDYLETLQKIARLSVPEIADWCVVDLVERGQIRRVAIVHADPAKTELANVWAQTFHPDINAPRGIAKVIRTGTPELMKEVDVETLAQRYDDPEQRRIIRELGLSSFLTVPLLARDGTLGAISLIMAESGRRYRDADVELATELARRAGIAVDNARLYQQAQAAVRQREDVLAIVTHDLRNPLGAIDLGASMLLQTFCHDVRSRKQIEIIRRAAVRMDHLINDLVDMVSIQSGRLVLEKKPVDASQVISEVLDLHDGLARDKGLQLVRRCELDGAVLDCDRERVAQAFANLVGNAIELGRSGDTITIRCTLEPSSVKFVICSTGPEIEPSELPYVFEPYWSAKRTASKGTGLGLYVSKGIIDAHGGTLSVDSAPGQGTTFTFTLPRAR